MSISKLGLVNMSIADIRNELYLVQKRANSVAVKKCVAFAIGAVVYGVIDVSCARKKIEQIFRSIEARASADLHPEQQSAISTKLLAINCLLGILDLMSLA